ncbi:MAG: von Willebrand factor type A domain-containing protein [Verrucomicrobiota bacterium]
MCSIFSSEPAIAASPSADRERSSPLRDNTFVSPLDHPLSTFPIDVDTASYTNLRRLLQAGETIPKGAVRIEDANQLLHR